MELTSKLSSQLVRTVRLCLRNTPLSCPIPVRRGSLDSFVSPENVAGSSKLSSLSLRTPSSSGPILSVDFSSDNEASISRRRYPHLDKSSIETSLLLKSTHCSSGFSLRDSHFIKGGLFQSDFICGTRRDAKSSRPTTLPPDSDSPLGLATGSSARSWGSEGAAHYRSTIRPFLEAQLQLHTICDVSTQQNGMEASQSAPTTSSFCYVPVDSCGTFVDHRRGLANLGTRVMISYVENTPLGRRGRIGGLLEFHSSVPWGMVGASASRSGSSNDLVVGVGERWIECLQTGGVQGMAMPGRASGDDELEASSVKKKRRLKMNKHKQRKRRRRDRNKN
eukprot:TRINITY_DN36210_c0_g1_i1.p1 TRINITY_DN36210_c0_g1~~TRINITY_DN36210_c0_g1_i1.p1  ORF type:complete len:335 (-),score=16.80 TRINITY_DN36210_c0_g1_i1:411-1415(-)